MNTGDVRSGSQLLAEALLRDVESIADRTAARMRELVPAYANVPPDELNPIVLGNTHSLLDEIRDPGVDRGREQEDYRASRETRVRQGIPTEDMLHGWRIGLEDVREAAYAAAEELEIGNAALLEFFEASLRVGDARMRASASTHHEGEIRELGRLAADQAALRRVATLVARACSPAEVFAKVAEEVGVLLGGDAALIQRFDSDGHATTVGTWGGAGGPFRVGRRLELDGDSVTGLVYRTQRPVRFNYHDRVGGSTAAAARKAGFRFAVGAPVVVNGRLWGAMGAGTFRTEPLPADTESRLADFSELVATAISNANARTEVERLAEEQAALRRVAVLVARESPAEEVFAKVAEEVALLLGSEGAIIHRFEPDGDATVVGSWGKSIRVGSRVNLDGNNVTALVYRTRRSVRLDDPEHGSGSIAAQARRLGLRSAVGSPIVVNGRPWGAIAAASSKAEPLPADAESRIAEFTELVATTISNVQARAEVERLADEQAALRRVATMVARECPPEEIFAKVAEEVGRLLGVDSAAIQRYEPEGDCTVVGNWGKLSDAFAIGSRLKLDGDSIIALVHRTNRPVRVDSYQQASGSAVARARQVGLRSGAGSPIVVNGRLWGVMGIATSRAEPLPAGSEWRIADFTELLGTAIANVQARSDLAASRARIVTAADGERRRVVRDLHDGAQQRLVHTIVTLKLTHRALERDGENVAALVDEALQHAEAANEELRELAHGILPSVLAGGGLDAGGRALASRMSIPVELDVSVGRLPAAVEATGYFIVAEALTNVAKHAHARRATVRARVEAGMLQVEVRDDGIGGARTDGTGLTGLRDRVAALDGSLRVDSPADGGGTLIAAAIPVLQS